MFTQAPVFVMNSAIIFFHFQNALEMTCLLEVIHYSHFNFQTRAVTLAYNKQYGHAQRQSILLSLVKVSSSAMACDNVAMPILALLMVTFCPLHHGPLDLMASCESESVVSAWIPDETQMRQSVITMAYGQQVLNCVLLCHQFSQLSVVI